MKMLRDKKVLQKMIITLIMLIVLNFIFPVYSRAEWPGGGNLFSPISSLICGIGDAIINVLQSQLLPGSPRAVDQNSIATILAFSKEKEAWALMGIDETTGMYRIRILYSIQHGDNTQSDDEVLKEFIKNGTFDNLDQFASEAMRPLSEETKARVQSLHSEAKELLERYETYQAWSWYPSYFWWNSDGDEEREQYQNRTVATIIYSPYGIFSNLIPALDVNFINPSVSYSGGIVTYVVTHGEEQNNEGWGIHASYVPNEEQGVSEDTKFSRNTAYQLRETIATWYVALRNIAIVLLLSILVYIAIRIILSTTAGETAKYKSMLKDWVIAMCILFFMHYMMAFLLKSVEMFEDLLTPAISSSADRIERLSVDKYMSNVREMVSISENDIGMQFGYTLMYVVLIFYTLIFTWKYLKRFIYLAFLTMISPLVAITYPIDKIKDGSAQAFNKWFKEYLFNVLIQPIHLLLYTILITSAQSLAQTNIIYSIVAVGFMLEAEKIIKDFFGIQTQRGEGAGAITGGAMFGATASIMQKGLGALPGAKSGSKNSDDSDNGKINFNNREADSDASKNLDLFKDPSQEISLPGGDAEEGEPEEGTPVGMPVGAPVGTPVGAPSGAPVGAPVGTPVGAPSEAPVETTEENTGKTGKYDYKGWNQLSEDWGNLKGEFSKKRKEKSDNISNWFKNKGTPNFYKASQKTKKFFKNVAKTPGGRAIKGIGNVAGRFINKDNAKKAIRLAAQGVGAATLGTVGLAAGLASENDEDILKYTGLGLGAGVLAGGAVYDTGKSLKDGAANAADSFQQGYYGDEYQDKVLNPKLDKQWKNSKEVKNYYKNKYGDDWKQKMDDALVLRKSGITDQKDIDTAIKLNDKNEGMTIDKAAQIMQFTKDLSKADLLNSWDNIRENAKAMVGNDDQKTDEIMKYVNQRFKVDSAYRPIAKAKNNNANNSNSENEQQFEDGAGI